MAFFHVGYLRCNGLIPSACASLALLLQSTANAQENCGFPVSLARSGFEDGEQPPSVVLPADTTPMNINVLGPLNGDSVGVSVIQVYGNYSGPATMGISVNNVPAITNGASFVSPRITLEPGANTLTIRYAALDLAPISITRTITYVPSAVPEVLLTARSPGDYVPTLVPFLLATKLPTGQTQVSNVKVDFDGDGSFEVDTASPTRLMYAFERPGLFTSLARVTFDDGNAQTAPVIVEDRTRVLGQSLANTRQTLCTVYYAMKNRLVQNNIALALNTQTPSRQARMQSLWTSLSNAGRLNAVTARLGQIADGQISRNTAELLMASPTSTAGEFDGFQVRFRRDASGVWRIDGM
jgi:hypothetical protein